MQEPAVKLCEICKKMEPYEGMRICAECMNDKPVAIDINPLQQCKICGKGKPVQEMHKVRKGWCNQCVGHDLQAKKNSKIKPVPVHEIEPEDENVLILDFTKHLEVLSNLRDLADKELRTPENQIIYWLIKNMR